MNTRQLECFLSLASTLNYARAAEALNTSQPAVTRQIKSLENELGAKLFSRSTRSVALTAEGKSFLADAKSIISVANRAKLRFENRDEPEILPYSIGCSGMAHMSMLVPVISRLHAAHPAFRPSLFNLSLSQILPKLDDETVDIALGAKVDNIRIKNCSYREIRRTRLVCVYAPSFPIAQKKDITLKTLHEYPSILYNPTDVPTSMAVRQSEIIGSRSPSEIYYCDSAEEAAVLAAAGAGAAMIPEILVPHILHAEYKVISDIPEISFGVYYKTGRLSALSREFIKLLTESVTGR